MTTSSILQGKSPQIVFKYPPNILATYKSLLKAELFSFKDEKNDKDMLTELGNIKK
ncbi:hypothetical protein L7F22_068606, partial [Adiantum nelumboides]|nr:hypothetical protein [Adiantum nelumboides]